MYKFSHRVSPGGRSWPELPGKAGANRFPGFLSGHLNATAVGEKTEAEVRKQENKTKQLGGPLHPPRPGNT